MRRHRYRKEEYVSCSKQFSHVIKNDPENNNESNFYSILVPIQGDFPYSLTLKKIIYERDLIAHYCRLLDDSSMSLNTRLDSTTELYYLHGGRLKLFSVNTNNDDLLGANAKQILPFLSNNQNFSVVDITSAISSITSTQSSSGIQSTSLSIPDAMNNNNNVTIPAYFFEHFKPISFLWDDFKLYCDNLPILP